MPLQLILTDADKSVKTEVEDWQAATQTITERCRLYPPLLAATILEINAIQPFVARREDSNVVSFPVAAERSRRPL